MTMEKIHIALLLILSSVFFSAGAIAQNKPLACQSEAAAGLSWENGRWVTVAFNESKFILVQTGNDLAKESVAKAFVYATPLQLSCRNVRPGISCTDLVENSFYFDTRILKGEMP